MKQSKMATALLVGMFEYLVSFLLLTASFKVLLIRGVMAKIF